MTLEIGLLGPITVVMDGRTVALPAPRRRVVLAALALAAGRTVSTAGLARYLWGEDVPELARRGLTTIVTRLRQDLGRDVIVSAANGYALTKPAPTVDVHRFQGLLRAARAADPEAELDLLERALACWRGEPLQDVGSETLVAEYAPGLTEEWYATKERRIDLLLAANLHADLVVELRGLTARQPLRESLWCRLIVTLYRSGRPAEALEAFQSVRELLADRLGVGPGPELMATHRAVLRHDPLVAAPTAADRLKRSRLTPVLGSVGSFARRAC
jgi:DNA-binding SARP family transcriptional activator